jgi:hypothetical protein
MDAQELARRIADLAGCDNTIESLLTQKFMDTTIVSKTPIEAYAETILNDDECPSNEKMASLSLTLQAIFDAPTKWIQDPSKDNSLIDRLFAYQNMYQEHTEDMTVGQFVGLEEVDKFIESMMASSS